jgi:hypothetical protein
MNRPGVWFGGALAGLLCGSLSAQQPTLVPEGMRNDMGVVQGYYQQVDERLEGPKARERDPFQATPALRMRRGATPRNVAAVPAPVADPVESGAEPGWRVQALVLASLRQAVLVREQVPSGRRQGGGEDRRAAPLPRLVREGDSIELGDGRSYRVMRIDRQGVLLRGEGVEEDVVRIR